MLTILDGSWFLKKHTHLTTHVSPLSLRKLFSLMDEFQMSRNQCILRGFVIRGKWKKVWELEDLGLQAAGDCVCFAP